MIDNMDIVENKELIQIDNVADTNKNDNIILPTAQADALSLLLEGVAVKDVASQVGVSERTIYRWMSKSEFKEMLNKSKEVILEELSFLAVDKLKEFLLSSNVYCQQFAVSQILKMQKDTVKVEVTKEKEYNSLEDLLEAFNK